MKLASQTQPGDGLEAQCLIEAAATELAKHPSVEAISIQALEGKISVATIGRVTEPVSPSEFRKRSPRCGPRQPQSAADFYRQTPVARNANQSLRPIRQQGLTVTESGGAVTVARVRCPTRAEVLAVARLSAAQD